MQPVVEPVVEQIVDPILTEVRNALCGRNDVGPMKIRNNNDTGVSSKDVSVKCDGGSGETIAGILNNIDMFNDNKLSWDVNEGGTSRTNDIIGLTMSDEKYEEIVRNLLTTEGCAMC